MGTADIRDNDGWVNISRTVALNPTVLGKDKSIELFTEVLNHIVPLRFTVDKEIELNNSLNLLLMKLLYSSSVISLLPNLARAAQISLVWGKEPMVVVGNLGRLSFFFWIS